MQRNLATEETVKAVVQPVATSRSSTPFATSPIEEWAQSASTQVPTCMYCGQRGHWMMGCAENLANEAKTMAVARGGTEMKGVRNTQTRKDWARGRPSSCYRSGGEFAKEEADWVLKVVWTTRYLRG